MKEALELLNALEAEEVFEEYAIGGAMAATFYLEAVNTMDLDVFVMFKPGSLESVTSSYLAMQKVFDAAKARGAVIKDEYIRVGKWPIQVLPPPNDLAEEAVTHSRKLDVFGVPTRVLTPEYLCAVAIQTDRPKDRVRVASFIRDNAVDRAQLRELVARFALDDNAKKVENWAEVLQ